jgi:hypothetical protein
MFSTFRNNPFQLRKAIAPNVTMDPDDVLSTKSALGQLGHYDLKRDGLDAIATRPMIDGLKRFQRDQGLKVDGLMKPDGPTATRMTTLIGDSSLGDGYNGGVEEADDSPDRVIESTFRLPKARGLPTTRRNTAATSPKSWFQSDNLKRVSDEAVSGNGRMLDGLLKSAVNGDLPNLFADALRDGGEEPVREFADFLRQLDGKQPNRVGSFEDDVLSQLTGADRNRIKRLADGSPDGPKTPPRRTMEVRPGDPNPEDISAPALHRPGWVYENRRWRRQTQAEKAQEGPQLMNASSGGDGSSSGDAGGSGEGGGKPPAKAEAQTSQTSDDSADNSAVDDQDYGDQSGEMPTLSPDEQETRDDLEELVTAGAKEGKTEATKLLQHFLDGSGDAVTLKADHVRKAPGVIGAQERVQGHFENWFMQTGDKPEDGTFGIIGDWAKSDEERLYLKGMNWEGSGARGAPWNDSDANLSLGGTTVKGTVEKGGISKSEKGGVINVDMTVRFKLDRENYNFDPDHTARIANSPLPQGLAVGELITPSHIDKLEKAGGAKRFPVHSEAWNIE